MNRREFLGAATATAASLTLPGCGGAGNLPIPATDFPGIDGELPWLGLAASLEEEHDYAPVIEGAVPSDLRGSLFRNGPGRFDRGGDRKRCILDGDGMIQAFDFTASGVRYRNRYTRTRKFVDEEGEGAFRYATWTTQAPGGAFSNLFARSMSNQAGVSTAVKRDHLYVFDESSVPHELDPNTLETIGTSTLGLPEADAVYAAHPKTDGRNGEWLHFGLDYGRNVTIHLACFRADGSAKSHRVVTLPRYVYLHDFFVTEHWIVLNLHPAELSIFRFLAGSTSLVGSMRWRPELGNLVMVVPREGPAEPRIMETDPSWMWHALNAYEQGDEIVADFVGYDSPDHFLGEDPSFFAIMSGRRGRTSPASVRRYVIDPRRATLRAEVLADGNCEFPIVNPHHACHEHRFGYLARGQRQGEPFWSEVLRIDTRTGAVSSFDFGDGAYCAEPIFAAKPGFDYRPGSEREPGWLLTQVYDSHAKRSYLAILRADHLADGPVARVHHTHHVPLSLHGTWHPRG